jgi:hypothetical protein
MRSGKCATRRRLTCNLLATLLLLVQAWGRESGFGGRCWPVKCPRQDRVGASLCGWAFRAREKGDFSIGKTEVGKGSKAMTVANGSSLPTALHIDSTQPRESVLAEPILATVEEPQRRCDPSIRPGDLVADKAYDGRALLQLPNRRGIKPAIPTFVRRPKHGRPIRTGPSYSHRCKVERCFD